MLDVGNLGMQILALSFIIIFIALGIGIYIFYLNKKFPLKTFRVNEPNRSYLMYQRTVGNKIVNGGLFEIMMRGERMIGEDLNDFNTTFENGKKIYLATMVGTTLLPIQFTSESITTNMIVAGEKGKIGFIERLKTDFSAKPQMLIPITVNTINVDITDIKNAKDIATRYVNLIDATEKLLDKQNPIILAIVTSLPFLVILAFGGVMLYMIVPPNMAYIVQIASSQQATAEALAKIWGNETFKAGLNGTINNIPNMGG